MWIPPATEHQVRMVGAVNMQSLYLEPDAIPDMPDRCQVVAISPFMRSLMTEAPTLPLEYDPDSRAGALMELIRHEMRQLPILPLSLRHPSQGPLAARCRRFVLRPDVHETIGDWSGALGMSRRAFTPVVPARNRPKLRGMAAAGLPDLRAAAIGGRRVRHFGRDGSGL